MDEVQITKYGNNTILGVNKFCKNNECNYEVDEPSPPAPKQNWR